MKTTIAIIGAGPGLGLASARRFGAKGFNVALLSRTQEHVDALAAELADAGITARGYAADVRDHESLNTALARAAGELGPVEILHYSPVPSKEYLRPVLETTPQELRSALEFSTLGAVAAMNAVLPGMRALGRGTALFVNGSSAVRPNHNYAAPPPRSPPNRRTPRCSTMPWDRKESTSRSSSFRWATVEVTPRTNRQPCPKPSGASTAKGRTSVPSWHLSTEFSRDNVPKRKASPCPASS
ncbi:SDR family NAD(P)-dependent oxidoreductase [Arthrobacter oryzae]|uniref:SDR family NAD(P)-dependent oxidoreductase n=1 Tax=Arthrobacter oryzae TaxID=409290 RepID=UPI002862EB56|nr:SDR family NAD(P)-dependent oxidoreductase [Arthrobacter oryzae]MDR6508374.1 NAD(P)-dependent dehydrogenase (short-subunit alcohol dehydrogenase family) [Arthrobacter oryzae]